MESFGTDAARALYNLDGQAKIIRYELAKWKRNRNVLDNHRLQLKAIDALVDASNLDTYLELAKSSFSEISQSREGSKKEFWSLLRDTQNKIANIREVFEIYRERFYLYSSPLQAYLTGIKAAELVASSCYTDFVKKALGLGLQEEPGLQTPMLQLSTPDRLNGKPGLSSPSTFNREMFPVPIIVIPIDIIANSSWNFLAIHHELGHNLLADFGMTRDKQDGFGVFKEDQHSEDSQPSVSKKMQAICSPNIANKWGGWVPEFMADLFALYAAGPAYIGYLLDIFMIDLQNANLLDSVVDDDKRKIEDSLQSLSPIYPPAYLRISILIRVAEKVFESAAQKERIIQYQQWLVRHQPGQSWLGRFEVWHLQTLGKYVEQMDLFIEVVTETPIFYKKREKEPSVPLSEFKRYNQTTHQKVMKLRDEFLQESFNKERIDLSPHLVPSAGQFAFEKAVSDGTKNTLEKLNERIQAAILKKDNRVQAAVRKINKEWPVKDKRQLPRGVTASWDEVNDSPVVFVDPADVKPALRGILNKTLGEDQLMELPSTEDRMRKMTARLDRKANKSNEY